MLLLSNNPNVGPIATFLSQRAQLVQGDNRIDCGYLTSERPDLVVSYSYRHLIAPDVLACSHSPFINLHISLLPYNRGADPNPWSFIENTPKGVSIHMIDSGIDTGPIVAQREVHFDESRETLGHSYQVLHGCMQELFFEHWRDLEDGTFSVAHQPHLGTFHNACEFAAIKEPLLGQEGWNVPIPLFKDRFRRLRAQHSESG